MSEKGGESKGIFAAVRSGTQVATLLVIFKFEGSWKSCCWLGSSNCSFQDTVIGLLGQLGPTWDVPVCHNGDKING